MRKIIVSNKQPCTYSLLEQSGFPLLITTHLLKGSDLKDKLFKWTEANWATNTPVTKALVDILSQSDATPIYVSNKIVRSAVEGVLDFAYQEKDTIMHLQQVFNSDLTVAGTPVPKFTNTLGTLGFTERQKLLRQHHSNRIEIDENSD